MLSGQLSVSLCGSSYDTVLSVHLDGCPATTQTQLVCNDDSCGLQSQVGLQVVGGQTYLIRVSGFSGGKGAFQMVLDGPPVFSSDCNGNGIPDECEPDCNGNGVPDDCDIAQRHQPGLQQQRRARRVRHHLDGLRGVRPAEPVQR